MSLDPWVNEEIAKNKARLAAELKAKHDAPEKRVFFGLIQIRGPPPHHQIETTRLNGGPVRGDVEFSDGGWIYLEDKCVVCGTIWHRKERGYYENGLFG